MKAVLVMFKPNGERFEFALSSPVTVIGRKEDCALRIPVNDVSRKHCQLLVTNGSLKLKDLGSSNGTYVNRKRVIEAVLKAGDRLQVGPVTFTVQIDGKPVKIKPIVSRPGGPPVGEAAAAVAKPAEAPAVEQISDSELAGLGLEESAGPQASPKPEQAVQPTSDPELEALGLDEEGDPFAALNELDFDSDASDLDLVDKDESGA